VSESSAEPGFFGVYHDLQQCCTADARRGQASSAVCRRPFPSRRQGRFGLAAFCSLAAGATGVGERQWGLAIARRAVEAQGGTIGAASPGERGCHFWIALPRSIH
jgi:hypothetical protein